MAPPASLLRGVCPQPVESCLGCCATGLLSSSNARPVREKPAPRERFRICLDVVAERSPEHLRERFVPDRRDPLVFLFERRLASKEYGLLHELVYTGYEQLAAASASRCSSRARQPARRRQDFETVGVLLALSVLARCAVEGPAWQPAQTPATNATIYVYRPYSPVGGLSQPSVICGPDSRVRIRRYCGLRFGAVAHQKTVASFLRLQFVIC